MYNPNAYKLAVRTIFRQDDNNKIKGYDLTYFTKDEFGISLWLGQAKLGEIAYCKSGINRDLLEKFEPTYLSKQLFFVCTKRVALSDDAKDILKTIEKINVCTMDEDDSTRAEKLIAHLQDHKIAVKIPYLLAYGKTEPHQNASKLYEQIEIEVQEIRNYLIKTCVLLRSIQIREPKLPVARRKIARILCVFQDFSTQPAAILAVKLGAEAIGTAS